MKITKLFEGENLAPPRFRAITIEGNTIDVSSIVFMTDGSYIVNDEFPICNEKLFISIGRVDIPIAPVQKLMEADENLSLMDAINIATK